jgi:ABC-type multidrug transport system fused ATPase/permease subunit
VYALTKPEEQAQAEAGAAAAQPPQRGPDPWRIVALLPAMAAMGLAGLYGLGGLLWAAELSGADLDVGRTLPLVPLEQVLARGIGVALMAVALSPLVLLFALGMGWLDRRRDREIEVRDHALAHVEERVQKVQRARRLGQGDLADRLFAELKDDVEQIERTALKPPPLGRLIAALAGMAALLVSASWPTATVLVVLLVALLVWEIPMGRRLRLRPLPAACLTTGALVVLLLAATYLDPPPLPRVSVETAAGERVRGELVIQTGDGYHVTTGDRRMVAIPARAVVATRVHQVEHESDAVIELITGQELIPW